VPRLGGTPIFDQGVVAGRRGRGRSHRLEIGCLVLVLDRERR
jgi:hypothetical protein